MFELVFIIDSQLRSVCSPKLEVLRVLALQLPVSAAPRLWKRCKGSVSRVSF